jgi:GNAT superfamily N-acetyltransferase
MPNAFTLRRATPEDAASIADVHVETWKDAYRGEMPDAVLDDLSVEDRRDQWHDRLSDEDVEAWLAVDDDQRVVGFAAFGSARGENAPGGELYALYVRPEHQRNWVGHSLLGTAETRLRQKGHDAAHLWVLTANDPARAFYEHCGWDLDGSEEGTRIDERPGMTLEETRYVRGLAEG